MSNIVSIEIIETTTYAIEVDLDKYSQRVTDAYENRGASFFSEWKDDSEVEYTDYKWG